MEQKRRVLKKILNKLSQKNTNFKASNETNSSDLKTSLKILTKLQKTKITKLDKISSQQEIYLEHVLSFGADSEINLKGLGQENNLSTNLKPNIAFVAPSLPHPCELEVWSEAMTDFEGTVYTSLSEKKVAEQFLDAISSVNKKSFLNFVYLNNDPENETFLSGLESEIFNADIVVALGENNVSTFQCIKTRDAAKFRLLLWQNSPRPQETLPIYRGLKYEKPETQLEREKTVRKESLRLVDLIITPDKDSSTWTFLQDVDAARIRRIVRGVNPERFRVENVLQKRNELRKIFNLGSTDYIFLQLGALELDAGALDSVYAFKAFLQTNEKLRDTSKLLFAGKGDMLSQVKKIVAQQQLDSNVLFIHVSENNPSKLVPNQLCDLIPLADAVIHSPFGATNGTPGRYVDATYDVLCAASSAITIISNGSGWVGEWISHSYKTFAAGNIHSLSKMLSDAILNSEKLMQVKKHLRNTLEHELSLSHSALDLHNVILKILEKPRIAINTEIETLMRSIEGLIKAKEFTKAISAIEKSFSIPNLTNIQKAELYRFIGDCFTKLGDLESGLKNYTESLNLDAFNFKTYIGVGSIALQGNEYNLAVPQFQKAVQLAPKDDMASLGLGMSFDGLKEKNQALKWIFRACNLNIKNTLAIYQLTKISYDSNEFKELEEVVERYLQEVPGDLNIMYTHAGLLYKQNRIFESLEILEKMLAKDTQNEMALQLKLQIEQELSVTSIHSKKARF
jgi:tetratricopeptide (TPR) repeat protein